MLLKRFCNFIMPGPRDAGSFMRQIMDLQYNKTLLKNKLLYQVQIVDFTFIVQVLSLFTIFCSELRLPPKE